MRQPTEKFAPDSTRDTPGKSQSTCDSFGQTILEQFQPAPELVVFSFPVTIFQRGARVGSGLIEEALARKVVIATPVTLISVLKGIAYGWNQDQFAENAEEIRRVASEMYERVQSVQEHYAETGASKKPLPLITARLARGIPVWCPR